MSTVDQEPLMDGLADVSQPPLSQTERLLHRLMDVIQSARPVPLSTSAMINRDEVIVLIEEALNIFPDEVRQSRWLLKEREDFLAKVRIEGDEILSQARNRAERMVQRSDLVRAAEMRSQKIVDAAEADARRLRLEIEDYCDQKLGSFEIVLERTMRLVAQGRERLQLRARVHGAPEGPTDDDAMATDVFDQDRS